MGMSREETLKFTSATLLRQDAPGSMDPDDSHAAASPCRQSRSCASNSNSPRTTLMIPGGTNGRIRDEVGSMITTDVLLFVRVAETASFKEAARQLNISPSQASKRIASLESGLGARLFYRSPRSLSLTSAGETLLEYYRRIQGLVEESREAMGRLSKPQGRLRFSVPTCLGASLLPKLHTNFATRY